MFLTCSYSIYIGYVIFIRYRYIVSKQVTTSIRSTSIDICSDVQKIYIIFFGSYHWYFLPGYLSLEKKVSLIKCLRATQIAVSL